MGLYTQYKDLALQLKEKENEVAHLRLSNRGATNDMRDVKEENDIDEFIVNVAWAIRSTYHTVLKTTPGAAIFGRDMFDIPYIADWTDIGRRRQALVDQNNARENKRRIDFYYAMGQKSF